MPYYFNISFNFDNPSDLIQLIEFDKRTWYRLYATIKMKKVLCLADSPFPQELMLPYCAGDAAFIIPLAPFIANLFSEIHVVQSDVSEIMLTYPNPHIETQFNLAWQNSPINHTYQNIDTAQLDKAFFARTTNFHPKEGWDLIICRKGMCACFDDTTQKLCAGITNTIPTMERFLTKISLGLNDTTHATAILHGNGKQDIIQRWHRVVQNWNHNQDQYHKKYTADLITEKKKTDFNNFFILIRILRAI